MSPTCCQPPPCSFFKTESCLGRCYLPRHKCLNKKDTHPGRVPTYMGWRYNAADSPEHQRRCGWRPGHVSCTVLRKIESHNKRTSCYSFCSCGNCSAAAQPQVAERPPPQNDSKTLEYPSIKITRHDGKYTIVTSPQSLTTEPWSNTPLKYVIDTDGNAKDDLADPPIKYAIEGRYNDYRFDYTSSTCSFVIDFTPPSKSCCVKTCGMPCEGPCCMPCGVCSELPCLPCPPCSKPRRRKPKRRKRNPRRPCKSVCCFDPCDPPPCGGCGTCATCLGPPCTPRCRRCRPPPLRMPDSCDPACTPGPNPKCSVAVAPSCCYSIPCLPTCCPLNLCCAAKPCCPSGERSSKPCANRPCCSQMCAICGEDPCILGPCCPGTPRRRRSKPRKSASKPCCRVPKVTCRPKCVRIC